MKKRPEDVGTVAFYLAAGGGLLMCMALSIGPIVLLGPQRGDRFSTVFIVFLIGSMAILLLVLAYGYYQLRPWAYKIVKDLVGFEDRLRMLQRKVNTVEVREAFGIPEQDDSSRNELSK